MQANTTTYTRQANPFSVTSTHRMFAYVHTHLCELLAWSTNQERAQAPATARVKAKSNLTR